MSAIAPSDNPQVSSLGSSAISVPPFATPAIQLFPANFKDYPKLTPTIRSAEEEGQQKEKVKVKTQW